MKRSNPARWLAGGVALLTMVATFLATSTPSQAATGDESHSSAQFISGTVLPIDLSAVAFLNGVRSDYVEQSPAQPADEKTGSIDVGALSLIGANLGTVSVPLGDLLQVGAVNQYSYAGPNGVSRAASGAVSDAGVVDTSVLTQFPANASLDLMKIIPSTPLLSSASFHMGAVTGVAALDGAKLADGTTLATSCADLSQPDHCRGYNIGDAGMTLTSPIFGTAAQTVNSALGPISSAINTVSSTIINTITSTLQTGLNVLGGNVNIQAGVSVNLQQAVDKVLNQTVSAGGVSINLAQGTIELDLNQLMGLNNMPPNTDVFSAEFAKVVAAQINNVMQGIQDQLNSVVANALDSVRLTINGSGCPVPTLPFLGCVPGTVSVNYDGSLQEFINGSKSISFGGSGFASLGAAIINPLISTVQAGLSTVVQPIISGAIATAGAAVGTLFSTIGTALSPALNLFGQAMQVRVNVQEENVDGQGTFTEVATRFTLLGGSGLTLNLGKAVVGPNKSNKVAAAPVITGPAQGSSTEDSTPAITGTGEPGATVTVSVDGAPVGTAVVQPDGTWTLTPTTPLAVGPHQVTATQNNGAGDSPAATSDFTVTEPTGPADTTPPAAPVITGPVDGSTTTDNTPTITGTGEPGATVTVTVDGTPIGDAVVQPDGTWTLTPTTPLADGPHTIGATQKDPAGNQSPPAQVGVTVDTTAPSAPEILTPAQGSSTTNTTPAVTGKGEPGATVTVQIDGVDVGTATVGTDGTWTVTPTTPLALGPHQVTATQRDAAGNLSTPDSKDFTVVAPTIPPDTTAPDAPVITGPTDGSTTNDSTPTITGTGEPGDTVTVRDRRDTDPGPGPVIGTTVVQPDGTWSVTPTTPLQQGPQNITADQTDPAGNTSGSDDAEFTLDSEPPAAPVITSPAPGSTTNDSTPTITGTGVPGDTVEVSVDGTPIGKVTVQPDGTWTLTPTTPLTDGPHTITATQTDPAGNTSGPATAPITVDSTPPAAPVITSPADGSTTNDTTPTITGTGEPGDTVTVRDRRDTETGPGEVIGTTKVQPDGTWTLTPTTPLPQGPQNITADQTDPAGNTSPPDDTNVTVDSAAPAAPVITGPANGSTTGDSTPTITGTGEPGATVTVSVDGVPVGQTTVQPDGTWSLTPTTPLADGPHTITARQTDPAGNPSPEASSQVKVDTATPSAPVILTPANGSTTTDTTPTITGTGEPGSTVTVSVDGTPIGTATVQPDGTWSVTPTTALPLGTHTVTATQTDGAGHTSPQASNDFTVTSPTNPPDTTAPAAPVITGPANGSTTGDSTPTITGTGEPGATVTVDVDGKPVGSTVVNPDGTWSYTPTAPLPDGPHTITARQTDPAGNTSPPAQVGVTVDTTAPAAPVILTPADKSTTTDSTPTITGTGEPGATVAVAIDGHPVGTTVVRNDGTWSYTPTNPLSNATHTVSATQTDPSGNTSPASSHEFTVDTSGGSDTTAPAAPVIVTPADGSSTSDPTPTITGTGEPGATVTVSVDGKPIGSTVVNPDGTWSFTPTTDIPLGGHVISAIQTDPSGNSSPSTDVAFAVVAPPTPPDTTAPAAPVIVTPADGSTTTDPTPTITGTGEPGATVTVSVDGKPIGSVVVGLNGTWTITPTTPLADGPHTVSATQTDPSGNTSPASSHEFTVVPVPTPRDTTAPAAPVIVTPADGSSTSDPTPTITGTGEPGATVTVSVDGKPIGSTVVNPDGTWSFTPTTDIPQGHHTVTARQTDPAGNTSPAGGVGFDIVPAPIPPDTTAPAAPVILTPADGSTTMDPTPTITGTGEPGATVTVSVDGQPVGSTVVKPDGSWSFTPTSLLPNGPHTVTARQTDPSGNTSPEVTNHFTVDSSGEVSQSPTITAPVILTPADGSTTTNPSPTVTGYGVPGTTVIVSVDGTPIGSAVVSDDGTWSVQTRSPLPNGRHTVTAQSVDPSGRTSPVTQNTFTVTAAPTPPDTTAPDAPVITSPTTGSTTSNPTPTITGTGEPGATVTVSLDGKPIGSTVVKPDGTWSFTPTSPLPQGAHTVTVTQTDPSGNTSPSSSVDFTVSPPVSTKPGAPVITGPSNGSTTGTATPTITGTGQPGATITVSVDGHPIGTTVVNPDGTWSFTPTSPLPDGSHTISVTQTDGDGNTSPATSVTVTVDTTPPAAPVITGPANGSTTNNSTPRITGTGEPGATVMVSIDGKPAGSTTVGADGTWSFVPTSPLGSGTHAIMVSQIDKAGNVSPSTGVTFTVAAAAVKAATGGAVTSNSQGVALAALACLAIAGVLVLTKRSVLRSGPGE